MPEDTPEQVAEVLRKLRPDQLARVGAFARALADPQDVTCGKDGFATLDFVHRFGDALRLHHLFSHEPFTKDKFEHAMVAALNQSGHKATLAPRGNPGHDLTVGEERWSLKTQADRSIKRDSLHISKFMELGKGRWETREDLAGLRDQMLHHMRSYDRIFSLRCFQAPLIGNIVQFEYELVEIPKKLLLRAQQGEFRLVESSKQTPKPGYCAVSTDHHLLLFSLYFDGGTERKLQIKDLSKQQCIVHATWRVTAPG
jgi:hypothetical protein